MKAKELIIKLQELIEKHGDEIHVFVSGYNTGNYLLGSIDDYVGVDSLSETLEELPESKIAEYHGINNDPDGPGMIYGAILYGHKQVEEYER